MCILTCTTVIHNIARSSFDNIPTQTLHNHHSLDAVYQKRGGIIIKLHPPKFNRLQSLYNFKNTAALKTWTFAYSIARTHITINHNQHSVTVNTRMYRYSLVFQYRLICSVSAHYSESLLLQKSTTVGVRDWNLGTANLRNKGPLK